MKNTALIFTVALGTVVSSYGVILTDTNIVGSVNTGSSITYAIDDSSANPYYITNSSISSEPGQTVVLESVTANQYALGTGGLKSTGSAVHDVSVVNSEIIGGNGGSISTVGNFTSNLRTLDVNGAQALYLQNVNAILSGSSVTGGSGGSIDTTLAKELSSANGGLGVQLLGTSTLSATNATISGGNGGTVNNKNRTGEANGGTGIYINGSVSVDLSLSDTTVQGGNGGTVVQNYSTYGSAKGGAGLLISGGANVAVDGGTYIGGSGGTLEGAKEADGAAVEINGSTVSLVDGTFMGNILLSGGTSTLSLKNTFTDDPAFVQTGGNVTFNEWYDGQLKDVTVSGGTMIFSASNPFNLEGQFTVAGSSASAAVAKFISGLNIKSGGVLDVGLSTITAGGAHIESNGVVKATMNSVTYGSTTNAVMGKISSTGGLQVDDGTKWIITDKGSKTFGQGTIFTLATSTGTITNNMNPNNSLRDVLYVGENGQFGWLGIITNVYVSGTSLNAVYGKGTIADVMGTAGDTSNFGVAMSNLTVLVTPGSTLYQSLADLTPSQSEARGMMVNGYTRTAEMANTLVGLQSILSDQIQNRTRSQLRFDEVGYPAASAPQGAGGWDFMRNWADRLPSFNTKSMRAFSDRTEDEMGYEKIKTAVDSHVPDIRTDDMGLPSNWQTWGRAYGSRVKQDTKNGFAGFDATIGGGVLGIDKRINNMLLGLIGGYTWTDLSGYSNNDGSVDTGNVGAYFAAHGERAYFDANADYAFNSIDTTYSPLGYSSSYNAHTMGLHLGGGYAVSLFKSILFTPEASIQSTYYRHDSYSESSSIGLPTKNIDSYDQWSSLGMVGATLSMVHKIGVARYEMGFQPELRAHYLHQFNANMDPESYTLAGTTSTIDTPLLAREEDLVKVGAGLRFSKWASDATEVGVDVDGVFGDGYGSYIVSGKIMHRF